jgi:hypothetical protein
VEGWARFFAEKSDLGGVTIFLRKIELLERFRFFCEKSCLRREYFGKEQIGRALGWFVGAGGV